MNLKPTPTHPQPRPFPAPPPPPPPPGVLPAVLLILSGLALAVAGVLAGTAPAPERVSYVRPATADEVRAHRLTAELELWRVELEAQR